MFSKLQMGWRYAQYFVGASNGKGHGIHSPFVYSLVEDVLNDQKAYYAYEAIEPIRKALLRNEAMIAVEDFGAGSTVIKSNQRMVKKIAASSLKSPKYAQLLFRLVNHFQPKTLLELGTSLGVTSAYLAMGNTKGQLYTLEGSAAIADLAAQHFLALQLPNIQLIRGNFDVQLPQLLTKKPVIDFAYIDGNHRLEPTKNYFLQLLPHLSPTAILVFDDIHWSSEMEAAWQFIVQHPASLLTIDLFQVGLVFFNPNFLEKQHFTIRF
jgi:predicted O-methyltransferase YrrM